MADETKQVLDEALIIVKKEREKFEAEGSKLTSEFKQYQERTSADLEKFEKMNSDNTAKWAQEQKEKKDIQDSVNELKDRNAKLEQVISTLGGVGNLEKKTDVHSLVNAMVLTNGWKNFVANPVNEKLMKKFLIDNAGINLDNFPGAPKEAKRFLDMAVQTKAASDNILRTDIGELGGFLTPPEWSTQLNSVIFEKTPIYKYASVKQVGSRIYHEPFRGSIPEAQWTGEAEAGTTATPFYRDVEFTLHKLVFIVPVTWDDLNNPQYNVSQEIMDCAAEGFAMAEGKAAISGNGVKKSMGLIMDGTVPLYDIPVKWAAAASAGTEVFDDLITVSGKIKAGYNPIFAMNRRTAAYLRLIKDDAGRYLWAGVFGDAASGNAATINGFRYSSEFIDLADVGTASGVPVLFGDFARGYKIINRSNQVIIRDENSRKKEGIVEFMVMKWTSGQVNMPEAIIKMVQHA